MLAMCRPFVEVLAEVRCSGASAELDEVTPCAAAGVVLTKPVEDCRE
jgi:hypothetical protein